jgi:hypothetical protein
MTSYDFVWFFIRVEDCLATKRKSKFIQYVQVTNWLSLVLLMLMSSALWFMDMLRLIIVHKRIFNFKDWIAGEVDGTHVISWPLMIQLLKQVFLWLMHLVIVWQHPFLLLGIKWNVHVIFWNSSLIFIGFDEDNGHVILETLTFFHGLIFSSMNWYSQQKNISELILTTKNNYTSCIILNKHISMKPRAS